MKELAMATMVAGGACAADATSASRPLATADAACASRSGNLMPSAQANLPLTKEWDKVFPKSNKVEHAKVTFKNRFGTTDEIGAFRMTAEGMTEVPDVVGMTIDEASDALKKAGLTAKASYAESMLYDKDIIEFEQEK